MTRCRRTFSKNSQRKTLAQTFYVGATLPAAPSVRSAKSRHFSMREMHNVKLQNLWITLQSQNSARRLNASAKSRSPTSSSRHCCRASESAAKDGDYTHLHRSMLLSAEAGWVPKWRIILRFTPLNNGNLNRIKVTEAPNLEFPFFFRNFAAVFENCRRKATSDGQLAHEIAST